MTTRLHTLALAALGAASVLATSTAQAQYHQRQVRDHQSERSVSYMIGYAAIDDGINMDSLARAWSVRVTTPLIGNIVVGEFALGGMSTKRPDGVREHFLLPEGEAQLQLPLGPFRPYFGLGGGWVAGKQNTGAVLEGNTAMATAALGLRTFLSGDKLTLNLEVRARRYGSEADGRASGEFTAGVGMRF